MKYTTAFLVTSEAALYFGFAMLIPSLSSYYPLILVFLGLSFLGMILAEALQKKAVLRALPLLAATAAVLWFAPHSLSLLMFLPPVLYLLLTAALGRFGREYWLCVLVAKWMLAFWIVFSLIALVLTPANLHTLILIAVSFLSCVFGLRMRRMNTPDAGSWLTYSFAELLLLPAAGLAGVGTAALVYHGRKIFEILATPFALIISAISGFFVWIFSWMRPIEETVKDTAAEQERIADLTEKAVEELEGPAPTDPDPVLPKIPVNWELVFIVLFLVMTAVVLVLIFRRKQKLQGHTGGPAAGGKYDRSGKRRRKEPRARTPSERIRQCYRAYLEIQRQRGMKRVPGDTSMDILRYSGHTVSEELETRLRDLYVKARYRGIVGKEEAREAEQILKLLEKSQNAG